MASAKGRLPRTPVHNPSTGDVIAEAPLCTAAHVNAAVEAAAAAFPAWMETPPVERARILFKFKALLEENFEDLVRSNTREHGKTLVESRGDVKRGIENRRVRARRAVAAHGRGAGEHRARH